MRRQHGFTLIEALTVVAVVVVVAALGTVSISKVVNSAEEQKLSSDVETLNRSVAAYLGAGGDLSKAKSPAEVLTALKRSLVNSSRSPTLSGSKVDERLSFVMQNAAESGNSRSRVYWDKGTSRFVLAQSGNSPGIREFILDDSIVSQDQVDDDAVSPVLYAAKDTWIWDYQDAPVVYPSGPTVIPTSMVPDSATPVVPSTPPPPPLVTDSLTPPRFSITSGSFPITDFDLSLTLTDPNPIGTAKIYYSINYGNWSAYNGIITVTPGTVVAAQAIPTSESYSSSARAEHTYKLSRLPLAPPSIQLSASEFTDDIDSIGISITNPNAAGSSSICYTVVEPGVSSPALSAWSPYSGGLIVNSTDYPAGFLIKAYAKASNPDAYNDSSPAEQSAGADSIFSDPGATDVLYVIDASGSMNTPVGSSTRFALVQNALATAISKLRPETRFNVTTFAAGVVYTDSSWQLNPATTERKNDMMKAIAGFKTSGGTNYEAALQLPLRFSTKPAKVYFLTDGEPSAGGSFDDEVATLMTNGIIVNTIGVDLTDAGKSRLKSIASRTGGRATSVETD